MMEGGIKNSLVLGLSVAVGLTALGYTLGSSIIRFREFERTVSVKGLSEREAPADIALWPIHFAAANNDLAALYAKLETDTKQIVAFLISSGFEKSEITVSAPGITDKLAQNFGNPTNIGLRYTAGQTVTVYSNKIDLVRSATTALAELGKKGIAFGGDQYPQTEYLFTHLNDVKPAMIEEATRKAREVAEKFAADSNSRLGKIKNANQGQFTVTDRDSNTPYIKNIRVVSTVEYYLSD